MIIKERSSFSSLRPLARWLLFIVLASPASAGLVHRWSFDRPAGPAVRGTVLTDPIAGAEAIVRGNGATFTGTALVLPGTSDGNQRDTSISAYVDLPNGLISSKTNLTIELWAAPLTSISWQRQFEFGRCSGTGDGFGAPGEWTGTAGSGPAVNQISRDTIAATFQIGGDLDQQQLSVSADGVSRPATNVTRPTTLGSAYHWVLTYAAGVGAYPDKGGRFIWYRNGEQVASLDVDFRLRDVEDVNNWLGRSQNSSDALANAAYDELRIHDDVLSLVQVQASYAAGPGASIGVTGTTRQITLHRGAKVLIETEGSAGNVAITRAPKSGSASLDARGRILYRHNGTGNADQLTYSRTGLPPTTVNLAISSALRIPTYGVKMPTAAPVESFEVVNAFPGNVFVNPLCLVSPPNDTRRLFILEREAKIKLIPDTTAPGVMAQVFLDLKAMVEARGTETIDRGLYGEMGLLGLAFHPNYTQNRQFFIFYSVRIGDTYYERVSRMTTRADDPDRADTASEVVLIQQLDREGDHQGGDLHFGPDGFLYIAVGDEGSQNDTRFNSQRIDLNFFSGILRIDVDKKPGSLAPNPHASVPTDDGAARYAVPADNPFVGATSFNGAPVDPANVRTEFWAVGLRSPWRFSFDSATGEIWCGDVGQATREEVNLITRGGNYGWAFRDGTQAGPRGAPGGFTASGPLYEYPHTGLPGDPNFKGNAIIGGFVMHGGRIPSLEGAYIFGDWISGNIWALRRDGAQVSVERFVGESGLVSFGQDPANRDILIADFTGDRIARVVATTESTDFPGMLSDTGLFADLSDLSPNPGLLAYEPNLPFWSDYAIKRRWFAMPDTTSRMIWSRDGAWTYPEGMLWVKHFDLELERGKPATKKRLETRVIVRNASGMFGVSYRWNDEGTDATLVPDSGVEFDVPIIKKGQALTQRWHIPSRTECTVCHNANAGFALSFNTRQLNRPSTARGFAGNQLDLLRTHRFFNNVPDPASRLPRHVRPDETAFSVEARVRSYLAVNCGYCHQPGGLAPPTWDARSFLTLAQTGLLHGAPADNGGDAANLLVAPSDTRHSVLLNRVAAANGFTRMPPLGSNEPDETAIALLTNWVLHPATESSATFNGLIRGTPLSAATAGFVKLTVSPQRSFSVSLKLGGQTYARTGVFDSAGNAVVPLSAAGKPVLNAVLNLNAERDLVAGEIRLEDSRVAGFSADRIPVYRPPERSPWEGRYTVALPGAPESAWDTLPAGCGFGTGVVSAAGAARFVGTLGDSTPASQSSSLSMLGAWPFHLGLYATKGALNGTLNFRDLPGASDFDGTLDWLKPADAKTLFYPGGFAVNLEVLGSRYTGLPVGFTDATFFIEGGAVPPAISPVQLSVSAAGQVQALNAPGFKLTLTPATGLFLGQFREGNTTLSRAFNGALLQKSGEGFGLFKGKDRKTGAVVLEATPF